MIKLYIDGKLVEATDGMTVLEAAQAADIYIPTLCSHPGLLPYGGCRLCIVEIEGMKGYPTSCTTPVENGMVVRTNTPEVMKLRRNILELILSEHPYTCLVCEQRYNCKDYQYSIRKVGVTTGCEFCPKNGQCELQKVVEYVGIERVDFPVHYRGLLVDKNNPFYEQDYNLCILCGRCVRVCQEVRGNGVLAFTYRGSRALVGTAFGNSHLDSGCEFCGACVDVCPTGALSEKLNKWEGEADSCVATICPYCGVGCQLTLKLKSNRVIGAIPANLGQVCLRGRFCISEIVHSPNRLRVPLIRKADKLVEVSWDEVLNVLADRLRNYKGEQFGFIVSPQCTNEDIYIFQKFTSEVMGSDNIGVVSRAGSSDKVGECNLIGAHNIIVKDGYDRIVNAIKKGEIKILYLTDSIDLKIKGLKLIVQSVFPIPEMELADVVLPVSSFAEVDGSFTNAQGKEQQLHKAIEPLYKSKSDWWILCEIANRMGVQGFDFKSSQEIGLEMGSRVQGFKGSSGEEEFSPLNIKPSDGFYYYRGCSLIEEVKGLREVVEHWEKKCIK